MCPITVTRNGAPVQPSTSTSATTPAPVPASVPAATTAAVTGPKDSFVAAPFFPSGPRRWG